MSRPSMPPTTGSCQRPAQGHTAAAGFAVRRETRPAPSWGGTEQGRARSGASTHPPPPRLRSLDEAASRSARGSPAPHARTGLQRTAGTAAPLSPSCLPQQTGGSRFPSFLSPVARPLASPLQTSAPRHKSDLCARPRWRMKLAFVRPRTPGAAERRRAYQRHPPPPLPPPSPPSFLRPARRPQAAVGPEAARPWVAVATAGPAGRLPPCSACPAARQTLGAACPCTRDGNCMCSVPFSRLSAETHICELFAELGEVQPSLPP